MANEEHLALLKQDVQAWNRWRQEHPAIKPDLSQADLRRADLSGVHLENANLSEVILSEATLTGANLSDADLTRANLTGAKLGQIYWEYQHRGSGGQGANLSGANLSSADLGGANLSEVDLTGATLDQARMVQTILTSLDLRQVRGLETVQHRGPSDIGIQTIYLSQGQIPEVFLRGAGVPENFIEYMRSLVVKPIDYYSCFISHSSKDKEFCQRLYNDSQMAGVRCWLDSEDLKIGDRFWERIDESIRLHDKVLIVLSEHSVESDWVEDEVMRALEKEREQPARTVLFPIMLDDAVMTTRKPWATSIKMKRHIGDFCAWKEHDAYQQAFARLLRDLQADGTAARPEEK